MRRVGRRLRALRRAKEMGLRELARKAKVNSGYLSELECGTKTHPSATILKRLARALRVPVAELLG
jgi:transcriptional regulator with XRE-family HTH domain